MRSGEAQRLEPLPLQHFLAYAEWFRRRFVPESDPNDVAGIAPADGGVRVTTRRATKCRRASPCSRSA